MGEVNRHPGIFREGLVVPHFGALVVGHRAPHLTCEAVEDLGEGLRGDVGFRTAQLHQGYKQSGAFDQRTDLRQVALGGWPSF